MKIKELIKELKHYDEETDFAIKLVGHVVIVSIWVKFSEVLEVYVGYLYNWTNRLILRI